MRIGPITLFEKKALTDGELLDMLGGSVSTAAGISVTADAALRVPAVASAVRTISEAAASLDVRVVEIADDATETVVPGHPATALLRRAANDWTSGFELIRSLMVDALTRDAGGLAWVSWVNGQPVEIIRYQPGLIGVEYSPLGTGEPFYRINGRPTPSQEIIHLRGTFDKAPLTLCREAIGVALVMEKHAGKLFGAGSRPSGVLRMKKGVGDDGAKRMIAGWKAAFDGPNKSGGTAILWDDAEWQTVTLNSVDAQFQQLRLFQLQEIARAFNMPASMLGDLSRATWSNSAEMQRQFLMLCLEPHLKALEGALRRALFQPADRARFAIRFDRDDFTNVDLTARSTAISSLVSSRVINPNEGRAWLGGLAPYDGGDVFANPNTGSSQPGAIGNHGASQVEELQREIQRLQDAAQ
jgi:HK97 family phage portal protein